VFQSPKNKIMDVCCRSCHISLPKVWRWALSGWMDGPGFVCRSFTGTPRDSLKKNEGTRLNADAPLQPGFSIELGDFYQSDSGCPTFAFSCDHMEPGGGIIRQNGHDRLG
jgi:hypothetical protein